jgi:hypothetical protein
MIPQIHGTIEQLARCARSGPRPRGAPRFETQTSSRVMSSIAAKLRIEERELEGVGGLN